jgi:CspA family cold shock protein
MSNERRGTVKRLVSDRGFGFLTDERGNEFFFHRTGLTDTREFDRMRDGTRVTFEEEQSDKGPRAAAVRIV